MFFLLIKKRAVERCPVNELAFPNSTSTPKITKPGVVEGLGDTCFLFQPLGAAGNLCGLRIIPVAFAVAPIQDAAMRLSSKKYPK
jgi:hypothetical protein